MELFSSAQLWIAVLTGGVAVKVIDYTLPYLFGRGQRRDAADERHNLRDDIEYLRGQIHELRTSIQSLENQLGETKKELAVWQRRYWSKKLELDRVIGLVRIDADEKLKREVSKVIQDQESLEIPVQ